MDIHINSTQVPSIFSYNGNEVTFKTSDGVTYVNATQMAKPFGKRPIDWLRFEQSQTFIKELSKVRNHTLTDLVVITKGGNNPGTWMQEDVGLEFSRWLSPAFSIWCNDRIKELLLNGVTSVNGITDNDIINYLKKEQSQLRDEYAKLEERSNKLELVSEFVHQASSSKLNDIQTYQARTLMPNPISSPKIVWQENFVVTYEQYVYDNISKYIDEWISLGTIPVSDFNSKYKPKALGVKMYIRAIKRYCVNTGIRFTPHKAIHLPKIGTLRCRIFDKL